MLRNKVTEKIQEIKTGYRSQGLSGASILSGFKALKLSKRFSEFNRLKHRGYGFELVLSTLLVMVVSVEKSVHGYLSSFFGSSVSMEKDVFYRMKNNDRICWRMILWKITALFLKVTDGGASNFGKPRYLIFDDSVLEKTGKRMEFIGRVWDHVTQSSVLGFKLLTMMYWDGISSIPLDFSFHREKGKNQDRPYGMTKKELRRQYSRKRIKESDSCKRIDELDNSKIEMVLKMFYSAVYRCLKVDYVLVDSWFTCEALIQAVRGVKEQSIHLIGMYKFAKTKFAFQGELLTHAQINNKLGKAKRCRSLGYHYKRADVVYQGIELTLFFSRHGKRDKWEVLLTTDTKLSFIKLIEHYQVRWTIEVFHKEAKQLLNLGKCQSNNFDAQIADTTISMIAYILLSLRLRYDKYESMGALYRSMGAEKIQETLDRRIWGLFVELLQTVAIVFEMDVDSLLEKILNNPQAEMLIIQLLGNPLQETG